MTAWQTQQNVSQNHDVCHVVPPRIVPQEEKHRGRRWTPTVVGTMAFPVSLSPSPVHEAFAGIQWDPIEKLELTEAEKSLLRAGEQNPVEYTLFHQEDAAAYAHLLLKVLEQAKIPISISKESSVRKVSKLSLEETLPDDEAVQLLYVDSIGVVTHYAISKLCEVIICLKGSSKSSKVTLSATFYPDGILADNWRPLLGILMRGGSDAFAQST